MLAIGWIEVYKRLMVEDSDIARQGAPERVVTI
jgi:hypothetical protein